MLAEEFIASRVLELLSMKYLSERLILYIDAMISFGLSLTQTLPCGRFGFEERLTLETKTIIVIMYKGF